MTLPLRDYLAQRRIDVQASIKALRAELAEIDAAEKALEAVSGEPVRPRRERGSPGSGKKTLKELALDVLQQHPDGLEASAILTEIKAKHGLDVARESMSPQLSRLRQDGKVVLNGTVWQLAIFDDPDVREFMGGKPAQKDETPAAATASASNWEGDLDDEIPF